MLISLVFCSLIRTFDLKVEGTLARQKKLKFLILFCFVLTNSYLFVPLHIYKYI